MLGKFSTNHPTTYSDHLVPELWSVIDPPINPIVAFPLFIALVYVSTAFINIPGITPGGLIHLRTVTQFTIAIVFGKKAGSINGTHYFADLGNSYTYILSYYYPGTTVYTASGF